MGMMGSWKYQYNKYMFNFIDLFTEKNVHKYFENQEAQTGPS
jgi:hypothetical protein